MSNHVYKLLELTGTSTAGVDDAIRNAIARAGKTVHNLRWFEVVEVRGGIDAGKVSSWQVTIKLCAARFHSFARSPPPPRSFPLSSGPSG